MTTRVFSNARPSFKLSDGVTVNSAGRLYFREPGSGSTTLKSVYSDTALTIPLTNPVILDSSGRPPVMYPDGDYSVEMTDSSLVTIWQVDNYQPPSDPVQYDEWRATFSYGLGDIVQLHGGPFYKSLQAGNINNTPGVTAFWSLLTDQVEWNTNETYATNDIIVYLGALYSSRAGSNLGNLPTDDTKWKSLSADVTSLSAHTDSDTVDYIAVEVDGPLSRKIDPVNLNLSKFNNDLQRATVKTVDTLRSNDAIASNDPELNGMVLTAGTWEFVGDLLFSSASGTPNARFNLAFTGTTNSGYIKTIQVDNAGAVVGGDIQISAASGITVLIAAGIQQGVRFSGTIIISSATSTVDVQWAQLVSNATAVSLEADSYIKFTRLL